MTFLDFLAEPRPRVFDGGMGTMLYQKGIFINRCFDELNLKDPELVQEVHRAYLRAGAELIETITPEHPDDPEVPNLKYTFADAFAEILPHTMPEYFWQTTPAGELEFAVSGWDVRTKDYLLALALGKAPLSAALNLRRISSRLANPRSAFYIDKYLAERGDARVKDWASWVANAKFKSEAERLGAEAGAAATDMDPRADPNGISYLKMQTVFRMVVQKVMDENGIDAFVNPENTLPPYRIGGPDEPQVNDRPAKRSWNTASAGRCRGSRSMTRWLTQGEPPKTLLEVFGDLAPPGWGLGVGDRRRGRGSRPGACRGSARLGRAAPPRSLSNSCSILYHRDGACQPLSTENPRKLGKV